MHMYTQKCLGWTDMNGDRSPQCKPLGGQSSWASVGGVGAGGRETVFAVAGMDSTGMFHDRAPGEKEDRDSKICNLFLKRFYWCEVVRGFLACCGLLLASLPPLPLFLSLYVSPKWLLSRGRRKVQ